MNDPKENIKFLSEKEVRQIIDRIDGRKGLRACRDWALLETLYSTGARISEALALPALSVRDADASQTLELSISGKGGWQRTVYISPQALMACKAYLARRKDQDPRLFKLGVRGAQYVVSRRAKEAGFEGVHPHTFRHSLAVDVLEKTHDVYLAKEFLGHHSISSTEKYLHIRNGKLKDLHSQMYK